jgi:hypothetical protein
VTAPAPETTFPAPARVDAPTAAGERPTLRAVIRHLGLSLLVATVVPTALFYLCLVAANLWTALIVALAWCYGTVAWRLRSRQRTPMLLWLTVVGLTGKTILALATGSTLIYFAQPAIGDATVAMAFLLSLATATPAVGRLAGDFYPMTADVARRPRVQRLFTRLTLLWAGICLSKAIVTLWLLHSLSLATFVAAKAVFVPSVAVLGAAVTVALAFRVARREGLLSIGAVAPVGVTA